MIRARLLTARCRRNETVEAVVDDELTVMFAVVTDECGEAVSHFQRRRVRLLLQLCCGIGNRLFERLHDLRLSCELCLRNLVRRRVHLLAAVLAR